MIEVEMRLQEVDPSKRYVLSIDNDNLTQSDVEAIGEKAKAFGLDALVIAGGKLAPEQRYWGLWQEWTDSDGTEHQNWYVDQTGRVYYYPSEAVARGAAYYFKNVGYGLAPQGNLVAREFV